MLEVADFCRIFEIAILLGDEAFDRLRDDVSSEMEVRNEERKQTRVSVRPLA